MWRKPLNLMIVGRCPETHLALLAVDGDLHGDCARDLVGHVTF